MIKQSITKLAILIVSCLLLLIACNYSSTYTAVPITLPGITPARTATDRPDAPPTYEGCAYVWASQDLPKLTKKVNDSLQTIDINMTGSAYAYGENCVYGNGHATFGAMETDYRVRVKVTDIKDEKALGDWIAKAMEVIVKIPDDEAPGPQLGRVYFLFSKSDTDQLSVSISIDTYKRKATGLTGVELFKLFYKNP